MPTISSRPELSHVDEELFFPDDVVEMIADAVTYSSPSTTDEVKLVLETTLRTLWNSGIVDDFYVSYTVGGYDVGFQMDDEPDWNIVQITA